MTKKKASRGCSKIGGQPAPVLLGVTWDPHRSKYKARVHFQGKERFLGRFATEHEAGTAYDQAVEVINRLAGAQGGSSKVKQRTKNFDVDVPMDAGTERRVRVLIMGDEASQPAPRQPAPRQPAPQPPAGTSSGAGTDGGGAGSTGGGAHAPSSTMPVPASGRGAPAHVCVVEGPRGSPALGATPVASHQQRNSDSGGQESSSSAREQLLHADTGGCKQQHQEEEDDEVEDQDLSDSYLTAEELPGTGPDSGGSQWLCLGFRSEAHNAAAAAVAAVTGGSGHGPAALAASPFAGMPGAAAAVAAAGAGAHGPCRVPMSAARAPATHPPAQQQQVPLAPAAAAAAAARAAAASCTPALVHPPLTDNEFDAMLELLLQENSQQQAKQLLMLQQQQLQQGGMPGALRNNPQEPLSQTASLGSSSSSESWSGGVGGAATAALRTATGTTDGAGSQLPPLLPIASLHVGPGPAAAAAAPIPAPSRPAAALPGMVHPAARGMLVPPAVAPAGARPGLLARLATRAEAITCVDVCLAGAADLHRTLLATECSDGALLHWLLRFKQRAVQLPVMAAAPAALFAGVSFLESLTLLLADGGTVSTGNGLLQLHPPAAATGAAAVTAAAARGTNSARLAVTARLVEVLPVLRGMLAMPGPASVAAVLHLWCRYLHDSAAHAGDMAVLQLACHL